MLSKIMNNKIYKNLKNKIAFFRHIHIGDKMIRKPEIMLLEESLHRRLGKYAFSEDYHYVQ